MTPNCKLSAPPSVVRSSATHNSVTHISHACLKADERSRTRVAVSQIADHTTAHRNHSPIFDFRFELSLRNTCSSVFEDSKILLNAFSVSPIALSYSARAVYLRLRPKQMRGILTQHGVCRAF